MPGHCGLCRAELSPREWFFLGTPAKPAHLRVCGECWRLAVDYLNVVHGPPCLFDVAADVEVRVHEPD